MCLFHTLRASLLRLSLQNIYDILPAWVLYGPLAKYTELLNFSARPNATEERQSLLPWKPATPEPVQALSEPHEYTQTVRPLTPAGEFVPLDETSSLDDNVDVEVQLSYLCSKCQPVAAWLQAHQPQKERHNPSRIYSTGKSFVSFEHYKTGLELEQAYRDGCHLCTLTWHSIIESFENPMVTVKTRPSQADKVAQAKNMRDIDLCLQWSKPLSQKPDEFRLFLAATWKNPVENTIGRHLLHALDIWPQPLWMNVRGQAATHTADENMPIPAETPTGRLCCTASESFLGLASSWIQECRSSHLQCRQKISWVPTRLLDLGSFDRKCDPRVVATANSRVNDSYLTLSYCWGTDYTVRLKNENIAAFQRGIPLQSLPKTIYDAIYVAKKLGFRWLWVDSLCIIQDNPVDRDRELAAMSDVYSNCFLTIAGLGASSSRDGLFGKRDPLVYSSCKLYQSAEGDIYAHPRKPWETFSQSFDDAALHQRAWVTQERILSPRTLNFGTFLIWECKHTFYDEFQLSRRIRYLTAKGRLLPPQLDKGQHDSVPEPQALEKFYQFWCELLMLYTKSQLSYKDDRTVALSGAIRAVERHTGWESTEGLWKPFLLRELLWFLSAPAARVVRPGHWIPSWSWFSTDEAVKLSCRYRPSREFAVVESTGVLSKMSWWSRMFGPKRQTPSFIQLRCGLVSLSDLPPLLAKETDAAFLPDLPEFGPKGSHPYAASSIVVAPLLEVSGRIYGLALRESHSIPRKYERVGIIWYGIGRSSGPSGSRAASLLENAKPESIVLV